MTIIISSFAQNHFLSQNRNSSRWDTSRHAGSFCDTELSIKQEGKVNLVKGSKCESSRHRAVGNTGPHEIKE